MPTTKQRTPIKSLKAKAHAFADPQKQIELLDETGEKQIPRFGDKLKDIGLYPLKPTGIEIFQMNIGKMCNQVCKHCHVDAGPDRKEIMTEGTMQQCLEALRGTDISTVDLTGGAPEMHPNFRWFVEEVSKMGKNTIVRSNLTIILANKKYHDLPEFFRDHKAEVVCSLPSFRAKKTDAQRGDGVFDQSIRALQMLNAVGYGRQEDLPLHLVYNPTGAYLPGDQEAMEAEYKRKLKDSYDIDFNGLFAITNLPISRFLEYLVASENYEEYMEELVNAFNPSAAAGVMCRNTLSVSWDGYMYDCDFNQMLDLKVDPDGPQHISNFDLGKLSNREIQLNQHCYGCTAGAGSSCGGQTT